MPIVLEKKKPFDLTKKSPGLRRVSVGLGWDFEDGAGADCDVSVFMLSAANKIPAEEYFVFYNNLESGDRAVKHTGDNRDGAGDGDDEVIEVDLAGITKEVVQVLFAVTIHDAERLGHHFGNISNAFVRVVNQVSNEELCRFTLTEQFSDTDSLVIGRLYRDGTDWKFEAMGDAFAGGLSALVELYT